MKKESRSKNIVVSRLLAIIVIAVILLTTVVMNPNGETAKAAAQEGIAVGSVNNIYIYRLRTKTKAYIGWNKVYGAQRYIVYQWKNGAYQRIGTTGKTYIFRSNLRHRNYFKIVPYKKADGKTYKGNAFSKKITMPTVITTKTRGYKNTYGYMVIKKGRRKLGCRYVWGANGPNRFDCSGFTWWTMKHSGIRNVKFRRTSSQGLYYKYRKYTIGRNLKKAQSGDMLLFGYGRSKRRIYHVGIYYAKGKYIHANGRKVTVSKVYKGNLVAIVRLKGLQ